MLNSFFLQISTAADSTAVAPHEETISILELIAGGGWYIMGPLGILSILAIYIFIERFRAIQATEKSDPAFMNQVKDFVFDGKIDAAKQLCRAQNSAYARMVEKGLMRIGKPLPDITTAIENVAKLEVYKLEKSFSTMATIAGAAPMIGFLGTVIGMITTFHEMYTSGNSVELDQLSGGIMQAMVTTAAGLVIGIIAYIGYNLLVSKLDNVTYKMEEITVEFTDMLQEPA